MAIYRLTPVPMGAHPCGAHPCVEDSAARTVHGSDPAASTTWCGHAISDAVQPPHSDALPQGPSCAACKHHALQV